VSQGVVLVYVEDDFDEVEVEIAWCMSGSYAPAYTTGPIDKCYPAQYPDHDFESVTVTEFGRTYHVTLEEVLELSGKDQGDIEQEIYEAAAEAEQDAYEYYQDCKYDAWKDEQMERD